MGKKLSNEILEELGLIDEKLVTTLKTLSVLKTFIEKYDWNCQESETLTKVSKIVKLCRKIESKSWKRIKSNKRDDLANIDRIG